MMRRSRALAAATLTAVLLVAGCGSDDPRYYTLTSWPGTSRDGGPLTVEVRPPTVADYLNRTYIVLNNSGNQLHLAPNASWAEPLSEAMGRNLALDLSQRLPGSNVYTTDSGIASKAQAIVEVNISQFAEDESGRAEITAMVSVHRPDVSVGDISSLHAVAPLKDKSMGALAAALSQLLGQVADKVATTLQAMGPDRSDTTTGSLGSP
jgi:uncharacterized lipoprotein YmbA